ncbi:hypothetical protein [Glaciimonas immobilis]|uniref:Uncharacterized protein n=1 Tax=Glaciimonas immobilis TaxID=728004 RepID=A0A840RVQ9_9BURK|nr:hypothetical protein [Glaciimonas immobilis]MBB5200570.1 hypothetical protein [Glaciimonas immobilis]
MYSDNSRLTTKTLGSANDGVGQGPLQQQQQQQQQQQRQGPQPR